MELSLQRIEKQGVDIAALPPSIVNLFGWMIVVPSIPLSIVHDTQKIAPWVLLFLSCVQHHHRAKIMSNLCCMWITLSQAHQLIVIWILCYLLVITRSYGHWFFVIVHQPHSLVDLRCIGEGQSSMLSSNIAACLASMLILSHEHQSQTIIAKSQRTVFS